VAHSVATAEGSAVPEVRGGVTSRRMFNPLRIGVCASCEDPPRRILIRSNCSCGVCLVKLRRAEEVHAALLRLEHAEENADVERISELRRAGLSWPEVASCMNAEGFRTRAGNEWNRKNAWQHMYRHGLTA